LNKKELKIAVFVSGRGSNLQAILDSPELKTLVTVEAVFSDKTECGAFSLARQQSIKTFTVGLKEDCISPDKLLRHLEELEIDLIVLAGYLKLIPSDIIDKYHGKIINIHPALLPSFGGKGMYGIRVHQAVFDSSAKVSGPTVHFVDNTYDTGKIIAQQCVDISDVNSPEEIAERVLKIEHRLLPLVIRKIAEGKVRQINNRVIVLD
jgi:formyltetrahydrofolate-dependent phosphoribosylglycinamide formyltransferase